jgi:hypothetical protein
LEFGNKDPKTAKPGARHYFKMNGREMILEPGSSEAYATTGKGGEELFDPTQVPVEAQGATSGQTYTVRPGTALGAEAQTAGRLDTQQRSDRQFGQGAYQFESAQQQHRKEQADTAAREVADLQAKAESDEKNLRALEQKRQVDGALYGDDAKDLIGYQSRAEMYKNQAKARADALSRSYGDLYEVGPDGVPKPKAVQSPTAPAPTPQSPGPTARPKVDHSKFEKMYAEAKTPEERAKLMKFYQEALKAAGQ